MTHEDAQRSFEAFNTLVSLRVWMPEGSPGADAYRRRRACPDAPLDADAYRRRRACPDAPLDAPFDADSPAAESLLDELQNTCERYERLLSRTVEGSDVSRINRAGGAAVEVDAETAAIIEASLAYSEATDGLFDITMGTVTPLWDFHRGIVPDPSALREALSHVGYKMVSVQGREVRLEDPLARIDLGGIAKGWIADRLAQRIRESGAGGAYVNLGGNVVALGGKLDGSPWRIGIRDPQEPSSFAAVLEADDLSVVTSGTYERFFSRGGRVYHHILSPKTGMPAETDLLSLSVLSARSIDGDGYSTGLLMMGAERALEKVESVGGIAAIAIDAQGRIRTSC